MERQFRISDFGLKRVAIPPELAFLERKKSFAGFARVHRLSNTPTLHDSITPFFQPSNLPLLQAPPLTAGNGTGGIAIAAASHNPYAMAIKFVRSSKDVDRSVQQTAKLIADQIAKKAGV